MKSYIVLRVTHHAHDDSDSLRLVSRHDDLRVALEHAGETMENGLSNELCLVAETHYVVLPRQEKITPTLKEYWTGSAFAARKKRWFEYLSIVQKRNG